MTNATEHTRRRRIVILGGGFAGAYCAQQLQRRLRSDEVEIVLIDQRNYFAFSPLLMEAGTGSLEPRHAVVPIRSFLKHAAFRMAAVESIDCDARQIRVRPPQTDESQVIDYDHLVMAMGSVTRLPDVPGLKEHGFRMKSLGDAVVLRDRAIEMLEAASQQTDPTVRQALLHFVVVGANFTGAEVAGELQAFFSEARRQYPGIEADDFRITLIDRTDRILGALDEDLSRYAERLLRRRGIDVRLQESVVSMTPWTARLESGGDLSARSVIWCAGVAAPPLLRDMCLPLDERGYVRCDRDLRVEGREDAWAIGDCAVNPGPDGRPYPPTAQHAIREGVHAARNIARVVRGRETRPCNIRTRGSLAALGCQRGVAKVFGVKVTGFPAWWLWRTLYLLKMPGWGRRIRIATDWTLDLVTSRSFVQLGAHRGDQPARQTEAAGGSPASTEHTPETQPAPIRRAS